MQFFEIFKRQVRIATVSGIPVRADLRWALVFMLMSAISATSINPLVGDPVASVILGLVTTFFFFGSIFLHEFAHAVVARLEGVTVIEIVLHPFGGLTRFRREPHTPKAELRIAVAGPTASFLIAVVFVLLMEAASSARLNALAILLFLLGLSNFLLAVFNMFPGYPLDGGRVLRAYLWKNGKDLNEATILTGRCGQIIAGGLFLIGLLIVVAREEYFTGFWAMIVGLFLYDSAKGIVAEVDRAKKRFAGEEMQLALPAEPEMTIQKFIDEILPIYRLTVFPVAKDRQLYGMLVLEDLKAVPRIEWRRIKVSEVMRPITAEYFVEMGQPIEEANEFIRRNGIGAVGVIDGDGLLAGFLGGKAGK